MRMGYLVHFQLLGYFGVSAIFLVCEVGWPSFSPRGISVVFK